jgi:hypothetical protein
MEQITTPKREITIDSNWIMTVGMVSLFVVCSSLLVWTIRNRWFERVDGPVSLIFLFGAVYYFLFAYSFPSKSLKVAFLLLGTQTVVRGALQYLYASTNAQHVAAIAASIVRAIAFAIILMAIVDWFRSVTRLRSANFERDS